MIDGGVHEQYIAATVDSGTLTCCVFTLIVVDGSVVDASISIGLDSNSPIQSDDIAFEQAVIKERIAIITAIQINCSSRWSDIIYNLYFVQFNKACIQPES